MPLISGTFCYSKSIISGYWGSKLSNFWSGKKVPKIVSVTKGLEREKEKKKNEKKFDWRKPEKGGRPGCFGGRKKKMHLKCRTWTPGRPFHKFGALKSDARRFWTTLNSSIPGFWGSEIVTGLVGSSILCEFVFGFSCPPGLPDRTFYNFRVSNPTKFAHDV